MFLFLISNNFSVCFVFWLGDGFLLLFGKACRAQLVHARLAQLLGELLMRDIPQDQLKGAAIW